VRSDLKTGFDEIVTPSEPSVITRPPIKSRLTFSPPARAPRPITHPSLDNLKSIITTQLTFIKVYLHSNPNAPQTPPQKRKAPIIKYITTREFGILKMRRETKKDLQIRL
jgi:hypothetical protein